MIGMIIGCTEAEKAAMAEMGINDGITNDEALIALIREVIALKTPKKEFYNPATGQTYGNSDTANKLNEVRMGSGCISKPISKVTVYVRDRSLEGNGKCFIEEINGYIKKHPDYPDFLIVTDDKNSSFYRTEDVAKIIITGGVI